MMNASPTNNPPDFDEEFQQTVADWREKHKLREDDATLLLVDLFRLHQKHWDDIRLREMPAFNQYREDISQLSQAAKIFQRETSDLSKLLRSRPQVHGLVAVTRPAAICAAVACLLAGYLLGRVWP